MSCNWDMAELLDIFNIFQDARGGPQVSEKPFFQISAWNIAHRDISSRLASIKDFTSFEQALFQIWPI